MADQSVNDTPSGAPGAQRKRPADMVVRVMAIIAMAGVATQFFLAGAGAFSEGFDLHVTIGRSLGYWTILLLIAVIVARPGAPDIVVAVILAVLAFFGQNAFAELGREISGWWGAVHAINGLIIGGLTGRLIAGTRQRQRSATA